MVLYFVAWSWYTYVMNNNKQTSVRHLNAGDVLAGSGFIVARRPWAGVRTPKGRMIVEGNYPGSPVKAHVWNASTTVSVVA